MRDSGGGHTPVAGSGERASVVKTGRGIRGVGCGVGMFVGGGIRGRGRGEVVRGRERRARVIAVGASGAWDGFLFGEEEALM